MKWVHFSLFLSTGKKLKTFPGDTRVHITWGSRDAIQKSPSRDLSAQRRRRGSRQDLFLKTNPYAFKSWQSSEAEQRRSEKGWLNMPILSGKQRALLPGLAFLSEAERQFLFLNVSFNLPFCLLNTCLSNFCHNQLVHVQMVCFKPRGLG